MPVLCPFGARAHLTRYRGEGYRLATPVARERAAAFAHYVDGASRPVHTQVGASRLPALANVRPPNAMRVCRRRRSRRPAAAACSRVAPSRDRLTRFRTAFVSRAPSVFVPPVIVKTMVAPLEGRVQPESPAKPEATERGPAVQTSRSPPGRRRSDGPKARLKSNDGRPTHGPKARLWISDHLFAHPNPIDGPHARLENSDGKPTYRPKADLTRCDGRSTYARLWIVDHVSTRQNPIDGPNARLESNDGRPAYGPKARL